MLLVIGDSNADVATHVARLPRPGDDLPVERLAWSSGGAGVNVATAYARLGGVARLLSRVGGDPAAEVALAEAARAGVDLSVIQRDPEHATGLCFVLVSPDGERTFLSYRGANAFLSAPPDAVRRGARRVHVCGHALLEGPQRETTAALCREARLAGTALSLDLCLPLIAAQGAGLREILPWFDLVFSNETETARLALAAGAALDAGSVPGAAGNVPAEAVDLAAAAAAVQALGARSLVVKRGARGASLCGAAFVDVAAFPVIAADTTAAGDAFVAAFLRALDEGHEAAAAARFANAAGALTAATHGSASSLPSRAAVLRLLEQGSDELE